MSHFSQWDTPPKLMKTVHGLIYLMLLLGIVGCAPTPTAPLIPTVIPFPTNTPGNESMGYLPTRTAGNTLPLNNPATAVAVASQPTATPNYGECPQPNAETSFTATIEGGLTLINGIAPYLSNGGSLEGLQAGLESAGVFENGVIQSGYDLTGEGIGDIIVSYVEPQQGGVIQVFVCENGRYVSRYENVMDGDAPQILRVGDMNNDTITDVLYASETCSDVDGFCQYRNGVFTWDRQRGAFVNLMNTPPDGDIPPTFGDVDSDSVVEVITRQSGSGNYDTGPIRTGSQIYDWNGINYVLSISQPDRIRFMIQAIHQADQAFREERMEEAAELYVLALEDEELGDWLGGSERDTLIAYGLYRLLQVYTYAENGDALTVYETIRQQFVGVEQAPIYVQLADVYWQTYQTQNNLNSACQAVQAVINQQPQALNLMNRYGTRNPTYTTQDLCPF